MENNGLAEKIKQNIIKVVISKVVTPKGFKMIRANIDNFDAPSKLNRKGDNDYFVPDITGILNGRKSYFEVAMKTDKIRHLVTKWKLLSNMARFKEGKLFLLVPKGHLAFTNKIIKDYAISAEVIKI